jgi:putative CocE/NonD family hydrolase
MAPITVETAGERAVTLERDVKIPMPDGITLAANLYLPGTGVPVTPLPTVVTFIPYHKDGRGGLGYLDPFHRHFASRGYAALHVDFRGTGSSDGAPYRTMDGRERLDGHRIVEWAAEQPWCNGRVGAWGVSYGGITAMAIAETQPPHLRAIVPIHAPDDNHEAMIVHHGARLMFWPDPHWGAGMAASNLMPPLLADDTGEWLRIWDERLGSDPWLFDWYGAPPTPDHWERQRIDAGEIQIPAFVICGWQDAYPDSVVRLWPRLCGPKKLLFGPWKHVMPEWSVREPVDVVGQIDRWWDRWLKEEENGVDREPPVTIFVQGQESWRSEREWPLARATERRLYPAAGHALTDAPDGEGGGDEYRYDARVGLRALPYDACTGPIPYPQDQHGDDMLSLCYTGEPLPADLEVTGSPSVRLVFSVDVPVEEITLVAKLCDVAPDGRSFLVTFDHLAGERSTAVGADEQGTVYEAAFVLRPTAYLFRAGHRLRLAVSGGNFPYLWPSPRRYRLSLRRGFGFATELVLPTVGPQQPALPPPVIDPPSAAVRRAAGAGTERYFSHREETGSSVSFEGARTTELTVEPGSTLSISQHFAMTVDAEHPAHASTRTEAVWWLKRTSGGVEARVTTLTTLGNVHIDAAIDLDGAPYVRRQWNKNRERSRRERR